MQRAIDRRKPYQEGEGKKDGFRDTLIWYTTQHIAVADRDCEIWLVSTNHRDFGDKSQAVDHEACPYPLHPHLLEDLDTADLSGRVSYVRTLGRLVQHLAGKYDSQPESQREALISQLNQDKFEIALAASVDRFRLNPAAAALPLKAAYGVVHAFDRDVGSLEFVDVAMRGGGEWTAQFKQPIYATVDLTDHAAETSNVDKTLNVAGRLTVGANGHVRSMIVTSIEALPDDPMLRAWRMAWDPMSDTGFAQNIRQQIDPLSNPDILTRIRQQLDPLSNPNTAKRIHESPMRPPEPDEPQKLASPSLDELAANDVASPSGEDSDPDENNGTSPE
uniref:DUF4935 domain-containing protein n=1 Tax=Mycobacterium marinum DL240490 TaxID=459420 RepID=B6CLN2_MYCMR|nr:conserved hypothetical protein [Mycobacterium marinum DL240490]